MIWRDDDIGVRTNLEALAAVDELFQRYKQPHTIAVMAAGMDTRPDLVELIRERGMLVALHCWEHDKLSSNVEAQQQLPRAVAMLRDLFGESPSVLYPPWNRTSVELEAAAAALGLTVSTAKISISQYLRANGDVAEEVVNFHYWHPADVLQIEPALRIAVRR